LRELKVGIDIRYGGVEAEGPKWIMSRMLQLAGIAHQKSVFLLNPTLETAISIYKTWLALDLPPAGIVNLQQHCMSKLMLGPAVTLPQMNDKWNTFPRESGTVRQMELNFVRSHPDFIYTASEFSQIQDWYLQDSDYRTFFRKLMGRKETKGEGKGKEEGRRRGQGDAHETEDGEIG
jgi:hypothetical protein